MVTTGSFYVLFCITMYDVITFLWAVGCNKLYYYDTLFGDLLRGPVIVQCQQFMVALDKRYPDMVNI